MVFTEINIPTPPEINLKETHYIECESLQPQKDPFITVNNIDTSTQTNLSCSKSEFVDVPLHLNLDHTVITIPVLPPVDINAGDLARQRRLDFNKKEVITYMVGVILVLTTLVMFICGFILVNALLIIIAFVPFPFGSCLISYSSNLVRRRRRGLVNESPAKKITFCAQEQSQAKN